jgi:predicted metal-dependent hydrolase
MTIDFPEPLVRFVDLFNRQEFWESHEVLEEAWRASRSGFYHGLILYASVFVHVQRQNPKGVVAQLRKTERALLPYPADYLGVDVKRILVEARALRQRVETWEGLSNAWVHGIVFPKMRLDPARAAGSEAELAIA